VERVGLYRAPTSAVLISLSSFVAQTKAGHTAKIPLLIGTNKVRGELSYTIQTLNSLPQDEGTLIVEGEPTAYLSDIVQYRYDYSS